MKKNKCFLGVFRGRVLVEKIGSVSNLVSGEVRLYVDFYRFYERLNSGILVELHGNRRLLKGLFEVDLIRIFLFYGYKLDCRGGSSVK
jgi:hypothetical protein